jgi:hypothetical protein
MMPHDHHRREKWGASVARVSSIFLWLKSISDYRAGLVTVVSHFQGGSAPELVTGVVVGVVRQLKNKEERRGEIPCGISPPLSELAKIRLRLPNHSLLLRKCSGTASRPAAPGHPEPFAARTRRPPSKDIQFPGGSMNIVADTREAVACSLRREDFSSVAADYGTRILEVQENICVQMEPSVWKWRTNSASFCRAGMQRLRHPASQRRAGGGIGGAGAIIPSANRRVNAMQARRAACLRRRCQAGQHGQRGPTGPQLPTGQTRFFCPNAWSGAQH